MADINFHVRRYDAASSDTIWTDNGTQYTTDIFDNMVGNQLFAVYSQISTGSTPTFFTYGRLEGGEFTFKLAWFSQDGFSTSFSSGSYFINHSVPADVNVANLYLDESVWSSNSWTPGTYDTFKNEITNFLATSIVTDRGLAVANQDALNTFEDWAVQIFTNQIDGNKLFVTFYAGDDPQADEIIVETV